MWYQKRDGQLLNLAHVVNIQKYGTHQLVFLTASGDTDAVVETFPNGLKRDAVLEGLVNFLQSFARGVFRESIA